MPKRRMLRASTSLSAPFKRNSVVVDNKQQPLEYKLVKSKKGD